MKFVSDFSSILIKKNVIAIWERQRQIDSLHKESFGILIGSSSEDAQYVIEKITTPLNGDSLSRNHFHLKDYGHQKFLESEWEKTRKTNYYLGFWHTHPESTPKPSELDIDEWKKNSQLNATHLSSLFFPIIGVQATKVWEIHEGSLVKMEQVE
jgi:integrative and conjugative element protein (TIGR02256 family)